jgi:hypothetical protein
MLYTFISHASEDKRERVRPVAEALLWLGVKLWLDRPGHGESHFGFDQDFIQKHQILSLQAGLGWREQIGAALREAGAVLVCISRALCAQRQVLVHELLLGAYQRKLVACVIDDIPYSEIPNDLGLVDPSGLQADRIDPAALAVALQVVKKAGSLDSLRFASAVSEQQWELMRKLAADISRIYARSGVYDPSPAELDEAVRTLNGFPIAPVVRLHEIPSEVIVLFSDRVGDPRHARRFFQTVMQVRGRCNPEGFTDRQILLGAGEVLNPELVTAEELWADWLAAAGGKSRRTLAAFLVTPGAPREDTVTSDLARIITDFKARLARPY